MQITPRECSIEAALKRAVHMPFVQGLIQSLSGTNTKRQRLWESLSHFSVFLKRWSLTSLMLTSRNEKQKEVQTYSVKKEAHLNMNAADKCCFNL